MNLSINTFSQHALITFKSFNENFLSSLTAQQKKIALVVSLAVAAVFSALAILYVVNRCLKKTDNETIKADPKTPEIPAKTKEKPKVKTEPEQKQEPELASPAKQKKEPEHKKEPELMTPAEQKKEAKPNRQAEPEKKADVPEETRKVKEEVILGLPEEKIASEPEELKETAQEVDADDMKANQIINNLIVHRDPKFKTDIAIADRESGGFSGPLEDSPLDELFDWTLEDGKPLIDPAKSEEEKTLLMEFWLFNTDAPFKNWKIYLPANLFEGKKEGDVIYFKYKGDLVELTLNHKTRSNEKFKFEKVFPSTKKAILESLPQKRLYGADILSAEEITSPVDHYKLGDTGSLYVIEFNGSKCTKKDAKDFREAKENPRGDVKYGLKKVDDKLRLRLQLPGEDQVDIVVNEEFLCLYTDGKTTIWEQEVLVVMPWHTLFKNITLDKMKNKVENATICYENGLLEILFPID